jgi:hypothetical protein
MERLLSYDRLIAQHRNKLDISEYPKDKLNMAYLDSKFMQFLKHLNSTHDVELVKKTLKEIYNQLQNGEEVYKYSIENPILLDRIFDYLLYFKMKDSEGNEVENEDAVIVRILASQCYKQFCLVLKVKEILNNGKYIKFIYKSFDDPSESVKLNVYQGLIYYAQSRYGIDYLLNNKILQIIINRLTEEKHLEVVKFILVLINEILNADTAPKIALQCEIIKNLKMYLLNEDLLIKENVILNYGSISLCEEGKKACVDEGSLILSILSILNEEKDNNVKNLNILIAATRFLMSTSILKKGKVEIYENNGLESLIDLLKKSNDIQLTLNILQVISNVAEEPRGRKKLLQIFLPDLEKYLTNENNFIKQQAIITKDIITWKP